MYIDYPEEIQDKIKALDLNGKSLEEIIKISINACTEMIKDAGVTTTKLKRDIEELQANQIKILYLMKNKNK